MALSGDQIVRGDKVVLVEFQFGKPVGPQNNPSYVLIERNDSAERVLYGTRYVWADEAASYREDRQLSLPYGTIGLPAIQDGDWSASCVLRLPIAKRMMKFYLEHPEWAQPKESSVRDRLNRGFQPERTSADDWHFPERESASPSEGAIITPIRIPASA